MRFEDERYVRLYTRDTATWKLLPWQSKCLLPLLMRKVDRAGVADVGDEGFEGIAALIDMPLELVEAGMPALLKRGVFTLAGGRLLMPNFLPAQEAKASDKLRAKEHRERVRARELPATPDGEPQATVTQRDATVTNRDEASRTVTNRHAESHGVTGRHTASLCAEPSRTEKTEVELDSTAPAPVPSAPPAKAPKAAAKEPAALAAASPVAEVFAHWQATMGKERAKLDAKRARCIANAIKSHGLETCLDAIDGCAATPFNMGENDRHTRYDDLTLILRDAKHIEEFAEVATEERAWAQRPLHLVRPPAPVVVPPEQRFDPSKVSAAREELRQRAAIARASGDYGG